MQHHETDISPSGPHWGEKEQTASTHVSLMIGTVMSHNFMIPAPVDNPVSCAQADGNGSMSYVASG